MERSKKNEALEAARRYGKMTRLLMVFWVLLSVLYFQPDFLTFEDEDGLVEDVVEPVEIEEEIVNGIHLSSGLIVDDGYEFVLKTCEECHSFNVIFDSHLSREQWLETIRWMQRTQELHDLKSWEDPILDYLAKNYGPLEEGDGENLGRRKPLEDIEWYELD